MSYGNGQAPRSALVAYEGSLFSPDMYNRVRSGVEAIRARGVSITVNQGYRFLGVPADRAIGASDYSANEDKASQTSDGTGNQYYQMGRQDNGMTPSAAQVDRNGNGTSNHGDWLVGAVDSNCSNTAVRDQEFSARGLTRTISSETWHAAKTSNGSIALPNYTQIQGDDDVSAADVISALNSPEGQAAIAQAMFGNDNSPDGGTVLKNRFWEALEHQRGKDAIAQGVYQNDGSTDGFNVLTAAAKGEHNPTKP